MSGWSNGVADFDNDGLKDLFVARSNVLDNIAEFTSRTYGEPNTIFRNLGKMTFEDVTAQAGPDMQVSAAYRGAAIGELDNDGRLDMVVAVLNGKAKILRNVSTNTNNWVAFKLVGRRSNPMAIGAQLKLTTDDG
jgi:enediyne biosynthesis protein E4